MKKAYSTPEIVMASIHEDTAVMQASGFKKTSTTINGKAVFIQHDASLNTETVNTEDVLSNRVSVWDEDEDGAE